MALVEVKRKDLVVGVEYILDGSGFNKAHYVGRDEGSSTLYFMGTGDSVYFTDRDGFIIFDTSGSPFYLEGAI